MGRPSRSDVARLGGERNKLFLSPEVPVGIHPNLQCIERSVSRKRPAYLTIKMVGQGSGIVRIRRKNGTDLITKGTVLATRRPNAAQLQYNPAPADTCMPRGTWVAVIVHELMRPAILIRAVQMAEPTRMNMLATVVTMAQDEAIQGRLRVHSIIPLGGITISEPRPKIGDWDRTDVTTATSAMPEPPTKKRRAK